jgi:hypothetical protein
MARLYRLLSPGIVFACLGLVVLLVSKLTWFHLRGGLTTLGLYTLALQLVLSALLISAIDDLSGGGPALLWHRAGRGTGEFLDISARPISFSRGLIEFYRRPFWPAFLLGFGLGASLSALAAGFFEEGANITPAIEFGSVSMRRSEAVLGVILLLGAALLWWRGGRSYFGWVIGICLATALGQIVFVPSTSVYLTLASWGSLIIALCLLRLLAIGTTRVWRARSSPNRARDEDGGGRDAHNEDPAASPAGQAIRGKSK